nr:MULTISPECIES: hypothetical protein [Borrelia]
MYFEEGRLNDAEISERALCFTS